MSTLQRTEQLLAIAAQRSIDPDEVRKAQLRDLLAQYNLLHAVPEIKIESLGNFCGCDRVIHKGAAFYFIPHIHETSAITHSVSSGFFFCGHCARLLSIERPIEERELLARFAAPQRSEWVEELDAVA